MALGVPRESSLALCKQPSARARRKAKLGRIRASIVGVRSTNARSFAERKTTIDARTLRTTPFAARARWDRRRRNENAQLQYGQGRSPAHSGRPSRHRDIMELKPHLHPRTGYVVKREARGHTWHCGQGRLVPAAPQRGFGRQHSESRAYSLMRGLRFDTGCLEDKSVVVHEFNLIDELLSSGFADLAAMRFKDDYVIFLRFFDRFGARF